MEEKLYTIFAGVNGAGKTSLYTVLKDAAELGERVNIDEIAMTLGGWKDTLAQIKAGRIAMGLINRYIDEGVSFHQETTLPGGTIVKQMKRARAADFTIRLYFVGVDDLNTAIERVHRRIALGGHGIDDDIIAKRFRKMPENLRRILPLCDQIFFYDNTKKFRQIAVMQGGRVIDYDRDLPKWFRNIFTADSVKFPDADRSDPE